ncbi:unnamed protein product, partial [Didymodactylos carnosus]
MDQSNTGFILTTPPPNQHVNNERKSPVTHDSGGRTPNSLVAGDKRPQQKQFDSNSHLLEGLSKDLGFLLNRTNLSDSVLNNEYNQLDDRTRHQLETHQHNGKLVIIIKKTDPQIMKDVVIFMYTGKCELKESNAYELLDAAGRYDIKDLKVHSGKYLSQRINLNNVLLLLKAAYKYDNIMVKHYCIEFFIHHAKEIMDMQESWKRFAEEQKELVEELLNWIVNKDEFFAEKPKWELQSY